MLPKVLASHALLRASPDLNSWRLMRSLLRTPIAGPYTPLITGLAMMWLLEVESRDDLHQPPARIVGVGRVPIGRRHLGEGRAAEGTDGPEEVGVVEGIQELAAQLKVDALFDLDLLHCAQIEAGEHWPVDIDILRGAIAAHYLNAARAIRRRHVASSRRTE